MEKITVPSIKPRNPLVAAAKFRKAGCHVSRRDRLERALRREDRKFKC